MTVPLLLCFITLGHTDMQTLLQLGVSWAMRHCRFWLCCWGFSEASATRAMNLALMFMYSSGFFIERDQGIQLSKLIMSCLQNYTKCARLTWEQGYHRFGLMPKLHYLHHSAYKLQCESSQPSCCWVLNPMGASNQVEEDFIGRPARLSRRINIRQLHLRVVQRSLICYQQGLELSNEDGMGLAPIQ